MLLLKPPPSPQIVKSVVLIFCPQSIPDIRLTRRAKPFQFNNLPFRAQSIETKRTMQDFCNQLLELVFPKLGRRRELGNRH